jgi:hypothetical protein
MSSDLNLTELLDDCFRGPGSLCFLRRGSKGSKGRGGVDGVGRLPEETVAARDWWELGGFG